MGFTLPSLPSLPSIRTLLDSEPQVLYPPSATNTPAPSPSKPKKVLPPVPDDWAEERGRRSSISTPHGLGVASASGAGTSSGARRPGHRRAHSALPLSHPHPPARPQSTTTPHAQNQPFPLGRLTEYSRNPASSSALSLPTLEEFEVEGENYTGTRGEGREAKRRASRTSIHSNYSVGSSLPPSPRRPICSLPNPVSVPPPIPRPDVTATKVTRPSLSPRCWSVMDVRSTSSSSSSSSSSEDRTQNEVQGGPGKKGLTRHSSYLNTHTRQSVPVVARPKLSAVSERRMSSSQVSDVAVLASWHFPDQDSSTSTGSSTNTNTNTDIHQSKGPGNHITSSSTSKDLSDRLRSLAAIDTSGLLVAESPLGSTTLVPRPGPQGFRPELKHRYTHSSPNLNIYQSSPIGASGGNGPTHRRGLRQPTPLGQTSISNSISISNLSSSPGSLLSDSTSNIGPPSPVDSVVSLPAQEGKWYDLGSKAREWSRSRRGSVVSVITGPAGAGKKEEGGEGDGLRLNVGIQLRPEDESDEEEDYIDYDGM